MELTQNPSVLELVRKTAELTTPKEIVWIDGSEAQLESLRKIAVETGELIKLNEEKAARLLSQSQRRQRRGACRGPDIYLLQDPRRGRPHKQLDGSGRDEGQAARDFARRHGRPHDVCHPLRHGRDRLPVCQVRHRGHGLDLRRAEHGHHDAHRHEGARGARRQQRRHPRRALQGHARPRESLHRPLPGGEQDRLRQLQLRRQRAAGQKVLLAAHRLRARPPRGVAG